MDEKLTYYNLEELEKDEIVQLIRRTLQRDERITTAIIFGSFLARKRVRDVDVAIHANTNLKLDELLQLGLNLEGAVKIPVDISPLSEMLPCMKYKIITWGLKLIVKDARLLHEIQFAAFSECQDIKTLMQSLKKHQCHKSS